MNENAREFEESRAKFKRDMDRLKKTPDGMGRTMMGDYPDLRIAGSDATEPELSTRDIETSVLLDEVRKGEWVRKEEALRALTAGLKKISSSYDSGFYTVRVADVERLIRNVLGLGAAVAKEPTIEKRAVAEKLRDFVKQQHKYDYNLNRYAFKIEERDIEKWIRDNLGEEK